MSVKEVRFWEELAANAWPAAVAQAVDGWRLRYSWGVTRRVNSVWPNEDGGRYNLDEKLALAEAFYGRFSLPARFQICPAAQPGNLDAALADRGYTIDAPTNVQTASITAVLAQTRQPTPAAAIDEQFSDWFAAYRAISQFDDAAARVRRHILSHIGPRAGFALVELDGRPAGIGLGVVERGWLGVFSMATHPDFRRRGVATAVLHRLAQWGAGRGAGYSYLQVMADNEAALRLYGRVGYVSRYQYYYRQAPK